MNDSLFGFRVFGAVEDDTKPESKAGESDLVTALKKMLAEAYVLYHTIHGFHWNVTGSDFYEYHKLFDEIVDDIYENIDPIAENIRKLNADTPFTMSELVKLSDIDESGLSSKNALELTKKFYEINEEYIGHIKNTFKVANSANEQGIANFIAERIGMHQKWSWFLKASLEK
jgi:starvation-inducible DNA-binding protein